MFFSTGGDKSRAADYEVSTSNMSANQYTRENMKLKTVTIVILPNQDYSRPSIFSLRRYNLRQEQRRMKSEQTETGESGGADVGPG